ncbi:MAG: Hsp20/alpha crystallin family protein [Acidobacteria bacterium]|nr:Hsp20/alpha crystallin family protein [Acidobacteriota bacterium]MBI3658400.1 Hsp20/alpha crystallin family protein [Acidobacteriota bacterium]
MRYWSPFNEMNSLFNDLDRVFRRTYLEAIPLSCATSGSSQELLPGRTSETLSSYSPAVEAFQKDNQMILRVELPGVKPEDVEITVIGDQLHLRGERKKSHEVTRNNYYFSESSYGRFERVFTLLQGIKPEDVKATFKNGVLELALPLQERGKMHKVKIEGAPEAKTIDAKSAA